MTAPADYADTPCGGWCLGDCPGCCTCGTKQCSGCDIDEFDKQARAEAELAGDEPAADDWPDGDPRRYMRRRRRWMPIDDLNDIDNYQPQEAA